MKHNPGFLQLVERAKKAITECSIEEVKTRLEKGNPFYLLDIREDHEFAKGHAKGAIHLGRGILERDIERKIPDKHVEIILYCGGGYRSALAALSLGDMGYTDVKSMAGGMKAWQNAAYPLEGVTIAP
ncbi:MAG: sulfurtransferase [Nitrospirota bacterium]|nr:MAG: sulfurtransferase [Nitrospirota bacterium]